MEITGLRTGPLGYAVVPPLHDNAGFWGLSPDISKGKQTLREEERAPATERRLQLAE